MDNVIQPIIGKAGHSFLSPLAKGYLAMVVVLLIWSGFALTARAIGSSPLTIADVALIRFFVPMVLFIPLLPSHYQAIKQVRLSDVLFILLGGVPFLFLAFSGAQTAPTAYVGTILAGTPPLFVALLSYVFYRQKTSMKRAFTLSLILLGIVVMLSGNAVNLSGDMALGVCYLLGGAVLWAGYTLGLKRAGLGAFTVVIILSYLSFFITLALILFGILPTNFGAFSVQEALPFVLVQGVGVGVLSTLGFSYAVNQLGTARSSVLGSISPGLTALLAVPVFGESLSLAILCGLTLTIAGVILSNRA